jgi:hypothetical protein
VLRLNILRDQTELICYEDVSIKYDFVPLSLPCLSGMHIAFFLPRVISSCVACVAVPYISTLCHKRHGFRGGGGGKFDIKCVLIFSTTFV